MPSLANTLRRCHSTVRGLRNSWVLISGFDSPSRASRAICASCAVSSPVVSALRLRTFDRLGRTQLRPELTNIVKHAQATCAWIRLEVAADRYVVEVQDDGIGGARPRSETSGLIGLSDRIGALSGTLDITSPHSRGTVLRAAVPIPRDTAPLAGLQPLPRFAAADAASGCRHPAVMALPLVPCRPR